MGRCAAGAARIIPSSTVGIPRSATGLSAGSTGGSAAATSGTVAGAGFLVRPTAVGAVRARALSRDR